MASIGKQAAPAGPATSATRDAQIVGTFRHPCQGPTTARKIERSQKRRTDQEGSALSGRSENTQVASTCSIVMALLISLFNFFLPYGTSGEVLIGPLSLNVNK